jgi:hypothetical protein
MKKEICTVFSSLNYPLIVEDLEENGRPFKLTLLPDYNFNVDSKLMEKAKKHPVIQQYILDGLIKPGVAIDAQIKGQENGLNIVDTPLKEGAIVTNNDVVNSSESPKYAPTKDRLISYHGVTKVIANRMLASMPSGGWTSKAAFLSDPNISKFEIDWSEENLKAS